MSDEQNDMKENLKGPDAKKILEYLDGSMDDAERARFEDQVPADPFLLDAMEGLQGVENKENIPETIHHLNRQLRHQLSYRKSHKRKKLLHYEEWLYWSIGLILVIAFIAFLLLRLMLRSR